MPDILHRVGVNAKPERVYETLATIDGLRGWWISTASGDPRPGGTIDFGFCKMQVTSTVPGKLVEWRCVEGPEEWVGTNVRFQLDWTKDQKHEMGDIPAQLEGYAREVRRTPGAA